MENDLRICYYMNYSILAAKCNGISKISMEVII